MPWRECSVRKIFNRSQSRAGREVEEADADGVRGEGRSFPAVESRVRTGGEAGFAEMCDDRFTRPGHLRIAHAGFDGADFIRRHLSLHGASVRPDDLGGQSCPAAFRKNLRELVADPEERERLGANGRRYARAQFDIDKIVNRFEQDVLLAACSGQ
jgi:hypothetical protein